MVQSRVKVTIVIETQNTAATLTSSEKWDIIASAVVATRAAIEQYIPEYSQQKVKDAVADLLKNTPGSSMVRYREYQTTIPIKGKAH